MRGTASETAPGSGVWRLRVVDRYDSQGRPHQVSCTVKAPPGDKPMTKKGANTELANFLTKVLAGQVATSGAMTFRSFMEQKWLPLVKRNSDRSYRTYSERSRPILAKLGDKKLAKIKAVVLADAYSEWAEEGRSPQTISNFHKTISTCLGVAVDFDLIPANPAKKAHPPQVSKRKSTTPTIEDVQWLVVHSAPEDPVLSSTIRLGALLGLRLSELCGLRWSDINRDSMTLNVWRAIVRRMEDAGHEVGELKNKRHRRLTIDPVILAALDAHRATAERWATEAGAELGGECYILTRDPSGRQFEHPSVLGERFGRSARSAGVKSRFHDLRHFCASTLLSEGVDIVTVAGRLGDAVMTVATTYADVIIPTDRAAASVMGRLLEASPGGAMGVADTPCPAHRKK